MIDVSAFANSPVAILGLGRTGLATANALIAGGREVLAWDDDPRRREDVREISGDSPIPLVDLNLSDWSEIPTLVLSPGIPHAYPTPHPVVQPARAAGCEIMSDIEILLRCFPDACYIGITGTNGKSTTTALLGHILSSSGREVAVGGNLGVPALALPNLAHGGIYVLELSSYQLELTPSLSCRVAILLNIGPDHLERHGGMAGYIAAKTLIFRGQRGDQIAIIGVDDDHGRRIRDELRNRNGPHVQPISGEHAEIGGVYVLNGVLFDHLKGEAEPIADMSAVDTLHGTHNWQNAAAACAAALALGVPRDQITAGLAKFPGLAHRMELIAEVEGIRFVNDSKATNVAAAGRALACYDLIYWIAGGLAKEDGLAGIDSLFPRIVHAFLIGTAAGHLARALDNKVPYTICGDLDRAVREAFKQAVSDRRVGAVVLLSPACASFDQFENFEARGDAFRHIVHGLDTEPSAPGATVSGGFAS